MRLVVKSKVGGARAQTYDFDQDEVSVGRGDDNDVVLPHASVSTVHVRLCRGADGCVVVDDGSTNGTWLGARRLAAGERAALGDGDVLDVADAFFVEFRPSSPAGARPTSARQTAELARELVAELLAASPAREASGAAELVGVAGAAAGIRHVLGLDSGAPGGRVTLGRGRTCDVILLDPDLSREHAAVVRGPVGLVIEDLGSKNGLIVDGEPLAPGDSRALTDGSRIALGDCIVELIDPSARYLAQLHELVGDVPAERASQIIDQVAAGGPGRTAAGAGAPEPAAEGEREDDRPKPDAPPPRSNAADRSWVGRPLGASATDEPLGGHPTLDDPPPRRQSLAPAIVIGALVLLAVVGLVLLFAL